MKDKKEKVNILKPKISFKKKIRCNICHEIPVIKEILISNGATAFVTSECLHLHGVYCCPLKDIVHSRTQLENVSCIKCNTVQNASSQLFTYCSDCLKYFCHRCSKIHFHKECKNHHGCSVAEMDYKCKLHNSEYEYFCVECNQNLCRICYNKWHLKHAQILAFDKIKPSDKIYSDIKLKVDGQKGQIDIISKILEKIEREFSENVKVYKDNLNTALDFNKKIFDSYNSEHLNYQSIVNYQKVIDIDISDISFVKKIQEELEQFSQIIKTKSSYKILSSSNKAPEQIVDKELLQTVRISLRTNYTNNNNDDLPVDSEMSKYIPPEEFADNELLKEFGERNKKILDIEEIMGKVKKMFSIEDLSLFLIIIDNAIFMYDEESCEIINYIEINEKFEFEEINLVTYYLNINENLLYLFIGTKDDKIKIYTINENDNFNHKLFQEIKVEKLINISCNENGDLLILDKNGISIYSIIEDKYEKEKERENEENKILNTLNETENYLIFSIEEQNELLFYEKSTFEYLISMGGMEIDEKSKFFQISENLVCVTFKNEIKVISIKDKKIYYSYEIKNGNYIQCVEVIDFKDIYISYEVSQKDGNKLELTIFEWNDDKIVLKETKKIEDLDCKMISKISYNKIILLTKYGINVLELKE